AAQVQTARPTGALVKLGCKRKLPPSRCRPCRHALRINIRSQLAATYADEPTRQGRLRLSSALCQDDVSNRGGGVTAISLTPCRRMPICRRIADKATFVASSHKVCCLARRALPKYVLFRFANRLAWE